MLDNIELIDSCEKATNAGRIHTNLIRLKKESFANVSDKWKNFRIALLSKKLDRVNTELNSIVEQASISSENSNELENSILSKTAVIARLEEKIKVLSKEDVPSSFVKTRAIKLKNEMMEKVVSNSKSAYTTETIDKPVVEDSASDYGFTDFSNTDFAMAAAVDTAEDAKTDVIDRDQIRSVIDDSFASVNGEDIVKEEKESTDSEDLSDLFRENIVDTPDTAIDREEIESVNEDPVNEVEDFKVSRNEAAPAKIEQFNFGEERKSAAEVYKPMSDEELERSRDNIEYDKYEESYSKIDKLRSNIRNSASNLNIPITQPDKNIRDNIIVTPDREVFDEKEQNIHFDYSEATPKDISYAMSVSTDFGDLKAMLARAAELKQEQAISKQELDEARRIQSEEARRAFEAKKTTEEKERRLQQEMAKLRDYLEALEEDIKINRNGAAISREDAECNRRFIKSQEMKDNNIDQEISNINNMISPEAINVRVTRR